VLLWKRLFTKRGKIVKHCNRVHGIELGDGYSLFRWNELAKDAVPHAQRFELPGDRPHYAPDRPADTKHVKLDITLDFEAESIYGTAYTTFVALDEGIRTITFDAVELHIEQVERVDGPALTYSATNDKLIVALDHALQYGEEFTIAITYHARPRTGLHFVKPAPEDPTRPVQAYTFGQPRYHSHWFPCHDFPNERSTTEIIATVPAQFITIANGNLLEVIDHGETKTHHWRHDVTHAAYLVSLVVGEFAVIEDSYNGKPVKYFVRKDREADAPLYMGKTPEMMRLFSEFTGVEYPYDTYDQTVVELFTGAMEHTTATTHGFTLLLDERASLDLGPEYVSVVAHELAHQWFGDLVTCRDWANGWLNEGFATYFEQMWIGHDQGNDFFKHSMLSLKNGYLQEDSYYRRPIVYNVYYDQGFELFDGHMYNKGGWVLHMLRHQLGDASFKRAIKAYLERYREKDVITADLERTIEEVTGRSMARFFEQWVYSGGYPAFEVSYSWNNEHKLVALKMKQTQKVDELTPCFVTPVDIAFTVAASDSGTRTIPLRVMVGENGQAEQNFYLPLEAEPLMVRFDPDGWLLKTLKFERPAAMLRYQLANDPDVLGRIEAAEALGKKGEAASFQALVTALNNDAFWGVRVAAAGALGAIGSDEAQDVLIEALQELDATQFSRVREAIANALGRFEAPQQGEQARRSASALRAVLEQGDVSYRVEQAAATSLGRTRSEGVVDFLTSLIDRPTWMYFVQRGVFGGLAATGEDRVVDTMSGYLDNATNYPLLRRAAAIGLSGVGRKAYLYSEEARQRAVTALCNAVEHDSWAPTRSAAALALMTLGERRAIGVLESVAHQELDAGAQRQERAAAQTLRVGDKNDEQLKELRKSLDEVREDNRKLRDQLDALEARMNK
jgi:aminopeptidase N